MPSFKPAARGGAAAKPQLPFAAWIQKRKEQQQEAANEAARKITNDTAKNEAAIVDTLTSIDFLHSRLPKEVLEQKSNPDHPCCDLEYASRAIAQTLLKNPQTIQVDLREIDQRILTLAMLFKQAVEQGDTRAAKAAKAALIRGVREIRTRVPQNQPELSDQFVKANAKYLDSWIALVKMAQVADRMKVNADEQEAEYNKAAARIQGEKEQLMDDIMHDPEKMAAFETVKNEREKPAAANWTPAERAMHQSLVEQRISEVTLKIKSILLQQTQTSLSAKNGQIETLYSKVAVQKIVADPNLMNIFQEEIDGLFEDMARSDAEIDETLQTLVNISGRIEQMENAPGALRYSATAAKQANEYLDWMKQQQEIGSGKEALDNKAAMTRLGLHSEEEVQALRQQAEEQLRQQEAQLEQSVPQEQLYL